VEDLFSKAMYDVLHYSFDVAPKIFPPAM
jgi:hypothetical protein